MKDVLVNRRHKIILNRILDELDNVALAIEADLSNELISIDIRKAIGSIGELTGQIWSEDILNNIFSRFCIGK